MEMNIQFTDTLTITTTALKCPKAHCTAKTPGQLIMEYLRHYIATNLDAFLLEENQVVTKEAQGIFKVEYFTLDQSHNYYKLSCNVYMNHQYIFDIY